jgi:hypothetical protein
MAAKTAAKRKQAAQKAALTRKRRQAGAKAALTRKRRAAGQKAALTRKRRAAGQKAAGARSQEMRKSYPNLLLPTATQFPEREQLVAVSTFPCCQQCFTQLTAFLEPLR